MSKKPQPQKADNQKHKIQHVNQQNEPYLRALQKRVRNLNKKLTEISELENKGNLKPEQIEKVNRKKAVQEEIAKIQENATFFRQVYVENAQHYRNNQLKELEVLARGLAVYHSGVESQEQTQLSALWRVIEQSDKNYPTLNEAIGAIGNALKDFANDRKLQKALNKYVEDKGEKEFKSVVINQEKIVNQLVDDVPSVPEPKVEEPVKAQPPAPPAPTPAPEPVEEKKKPEPKEEKVEKAPEVIVEKEPTPIVEAPPKEDKPEAEGSKVAEEKKEGDRPRRENRERPYKGKGGYKGNRKEGEQKYEPRDRERKQNYKPKYQEKQAEGEQRQRSGSSSSSSSSEEARQFKKEEIKKLEDEGFTVVGKPKPKVKDPKERKDFHDHQHGKKHHHHGRSNNY